MLSLDLSSFPTLHTERLVLRELAPSDAQALFVLRSDPRVMQYIGRPTATTIRDAEELLERIAQGRTENASISWGLTLKGNDTVIGTIGYYRLKPEHHTAEVGYALSADHWGRGLMGEALDVVVAHGFELFRFHRIEAITEPRNTASRTLLERHGFALEGLLKENYLWNGEFQDSAIYGRLKG